MASLEELHLLEVKLQPLTGLDKAVQALLAAAAGGGRRLRVLEARRCPLLGNKTVRKASLCACGFDKGKCCACG
jgi:hypothetical protein